MSVQTASEIKPGARIGDTYEVLRLIGRGGMGAVWEAQHLRLPRKVALKVLRDGLEDDVAHQRFRREAEIASRLAHPNIVEVFDFNTLPDGTPYLVLAMLNGESLAERLKRGRLGWEPALAVTRQIASALHAAHREHVVHRDLKPANVFLCDQPDAPHPLVKVLDFGISKICGVDSNLTGSQVLLGTPRYMSPEQITGELPIDPRTDQFALAALVFEMLAGEQLYGGQVNEVLYKIVNSRPALGAVEGSISDRSVKALRRALAKNPADRFADVNAFVAEFAEDEPSIEELPTTVRSRPSSSAALPRWGVAAAAAILLGAGGVGYWLFGSGAAAPAPRPVGPLAAADAGSSSSSVQIETADAGEVKAEGAPVKPSKFEPAEREPPIAAEVAADLDAADRALSQKDFRQATFLARRSLLKQETGRAHAIIARSACGEGDLGKARAALYGVRKRDRAGVVAACREAGLELE